MPVLDQIGAEREFRTRDLAEHGWRLSPDRLAAHVTRNDPVVEGFGGGFQMAGPYRRPAHVRLLGKHISRAVTKGNGRLIINLPPQVGKSQLTSIWTPTWAHHLTGGRARVLLGGYQARFAATFGKAVMENVQKYGNELMLELNPNTQARDVWETTAGGGMQTGGTDGSMIGKPGDLIVIDDPFKNFKEAHSPTVRQDVWDWFWAVPMTRLQPGTTVIVVQTRWHEDDLTGRLLSSESADRWNLLAIPALCDDPEHDLLARRLGESIWPERFDEEHYQILEVEQGPYRWAGMYQQHPAPLQGDIFKRVHWQYCDEAPVGQMRWLVRRWDLAATEDGGDYTAGVLMGRTDRGMTYVLDVQHDRLSTLGVEKLIKQTAENDRRTYGPKVLIRLEQEGGSSGKDQAFNYVADLLAGYPAKAEPSSGDKTYRAWAYAAQQEAEHVFLCSGKRENGDYYKPQWHAEFVEEHAVFPNGAHDDMVDAASHAYNDLIKLQKRTKKATASTLAGEKIGPKELPGGRYGTQPPRRGV